MFNDLASEKLDLTSIATAFSCVIHIQFATLHVQSSLGAFVHWRGIAFWLQLDVPMQTWDGPRERFSRIITVADEKDFARSYWTAKMPQWKNKTVHTKCLIASIDHG